MINRSYKVLRMLAFPFVWVYREMYRLISAVLLFLALTLDGFMHMLSIPHMEGWWIPLLGGSAAVSGVGAWLHQWRKKPQG